MDSSLCLCRCFLRLLLREKVSSQKGHRFGTVCVFSLCEYRVCFVGNSLSQSLHFSKSLLWWLMCFNRPLLLPKVFLHTSQACLVPVCMLRCLEKTTWLWNLLWQTWHLNFWLCHSRWLLRHPTSLTQMWQNLVFFLCSVKSRRNYCSA